MDRNSILGFLLLGLLLVGYLLYNQKSEQQYVKYKKATEDSIALVKAQQLKTEAATAKLAAPPDSLQLHKNDSIQRVSQLGVFANAGKGEEQVTTLENNLIRISFSNKGARPEKVQLKKYKTYDQQPLILSSSAYESLALQFTTNLGQTINTGNLLFSLVSNTKNPDSSQTLVYRLNAGNDQQYVEYVYTIHPNQYMMDFNIRTSGLESILPPAENSFTLLWQDQANHLERDSSVEKRNTQIYYRSKAGDVDYFSLYKTTDKQLTAPLQWVSFKQQFFNITYIAQNSFSAATINAHEAPDSANYVAQSSVAFTIPYNRSPDFSFPMQVYYGPNDYYLLKSYDKSLESVVPLGYSIYAFVKYINKWLLLPIFIFLGKLIGNWGVVVIILTVLLRLLISPLTYKSYLSQAKMKVLKPELDELREKFKDDQQKFGMEQMKLYRTAGVSPLGGCIPMVLQVPIFFALYCLFQSVIQVRQQPFLWCSDLSSYDSIFHLPFRIPAYGDHVSLFTLLMTASSLFLAFYNKNNMTPGAGAGGQNMAFMKYLPYIMPIFFLGFFNSMAAALTLYYVVSNVITILIQWVIQTYIIDEKAIHQQIQENKKRPKKQSKWSERLEQIQKQQAVTAQRKK